MRECLDESIKKGERVCQNRNSVEVTVKIPADLACDGKAKWKSVFIDKCISRIVDGLQCVGVDMRGSCCGHDSGIGDIELQDGRGLIILSREMYQKFQCDSGTNMERLSRVLET